MLIFNYGEWAFWDAYDPANGIVGPQKVTFDGPNKLILVNYGETELDVQVDIYSNWKEWVQLYDNSKYPQAFSILGGDPIDDTRSVGITYFLENGWRIKTWEGDHQLVIDGNLYTREPGGNIAVPIDGDFRVTVSLTRSNLVDLVDPDVALSNTEFALIANNVWSEVEPVTGKTHGELAQETANNASDALKKGEFLALQE